MKFPKLIHITIGIIALACIGIGILLSIPDAKKEALTVKDDKTSTEVGQTLEDQGREHIDIGASHEPYNSNPPTSGPHYIQPAEWGIYENPLPDEQLVHNLEHGGIWISYKNIDPETKSKLEAIAKANSGIIFTPRSTNDQTIAIASWRHLETMDSYDETKILEFIRANKNKSPEPEAP